MRGPLVAAKAGIKIRLGPPAAKVVRTLPANWRFRSINVIQTTHASDLSARGFDTRKKYREPGNLPCCSHFVDEHNGRYE